MFFFILGEPHYTTSSWYKNILSGIFSEKRSKHFSAIIVDSFEEIKSFPKNSDDVILLIGSDAEWLESVIDICEERFNKNVIVLGNFERRLVGRSYSMVSSDISKDLGNIYTYLTSNGKNRIALYGINPKSASDSFRENSFLECGGCKEDIYLNNSNLAECYKDFSNNIGKYDAVLCANDYSAISLIRYLKAAEASLPFIASCGETRLARIFSPSITNLKTNYSDFGRAAVHLYKTLQKDLGISSVKIRLVSSIVPAETTDNLPYTENSAKSVPKKNRYDNSFYSDPEVADMLRIENVLNSCDKNEFEMLCYLISDMTYFDIAEKCHMSVNGVKYRLKKLFELSGVSSKSEFLNLTKNYMG